MMIDIIKEGINDYHVIYHIQGFIISLNYTTLKIFQHFSVVWNSRQDRLLKF